MTEKETYRALEKALVRLNPKRLASHAFVDGGSFCSLGALVASLVEKERRIDIDPSERVVIDGLPRSFWDTRAYRQAMRSCDTTAWSRIRDKNDYYRGGGSGETPEQRYERMLQWARMQAQA